MSEFWKPYGDVDNKIQIVKEMVGENLRAVKGPARETIDYLLRSEGKYLRAGITILSGQVGRCETDEPITAAAAFEMLHMATLVHDDIIDDSEQRRGKLSLQQKFGKDVAVYTGDYILARAYRFITEKHFEFLSPLSKGIEKICLGEINQNLNRYNMNATYRDYIKTISGKTAALFYMCAYAGGTIAKMDERQIKTLANSAKHMGIAFQIKDDCSDYDSDCQRLRKEPGSDIAQGIYTLPVILALKSNEIPTLRALMEARDDRAVMEIIRASKSLKQSRKIAGICMKKALKGLHTLERNQGSVILERVYRHLMEGL